jgi:hypothetical protein
MERKTWQKPQLIVLTRSKPEEALLIGCKGNTQVPNAPGNVIDSCYNPECQQCFIYNISS